MYRKSFATLAAAIITSAILTGCNKSSEPDPALEEYYVRYNAYAPLPADTISISYRMADGHQKQVKDVFPEGHFQVTVGPVLAGFQAKMVSNLSIGMDAPTMSIETKKGNGVFSLKIQRENAITLSYTVGE